MTGVHKEVCNRDVTKVGPVTHQPSLSADSHSSFANFFWSVIIGIQWRRRG